MNYQTELEYQKTILKLKDEQIALLEKFLTYVDEHNKVVRVYEERIEAFKQIIAKGK